MTPEAKVKAMVKKILNVRGAYFFPVVQNGFGISGVPDIVGCWKGRFFAVECKAGNNQPTALQELQIQKIRDAKGFVCVIRNEADALLLSIWLDTQ